jgi:hypothetical protein
LGDQPESHGLGARLAASADAELSQDRRHVVVDRLLGHDEALGDLGVAPTPGEELEDFELPFGEAARILACRRPWAAGQTALTQLAQPTGPTTCTQP